MGIVLVVEDDAVICHLVTIVLEDAGYQAVTAPDAGTAMALLADHQPDLILLDSSSGPVSEGDFVRHYRAQPGQHAPVILFTATVNPRDRAQSIGADDMLTKPFNVDDLVTLVQRYILGSPGQHTDQDSSGEQAGRAV